MHFTTLSIASQIWERGGAGRGESHLMEKAPHRIFGRTEGARYARAGSAVFTLALVYASELCFNYADITVIMCTSQFRRIISCTLNEPCKC